jgi:glycosyltransferase involved in cell wall biosynthesis
MKDICLIPCYNRPEFLYWTLKQIEKAYLSHKIEYWFLADHGYNPEILEIIKDFKYSKKIIKQTKHNYHSATKLSRNILSGYKKAYQTKAKYIFLIEDDILIGKDFFKMHYGIQNDENIFCSIMSENHNTKFDTSNNLNNYYISKQADYQSIGVCFKRVNLKQIVKHLIPEYLNNPFKYVNKLYPKSKIGSQYVEQAGLIRRIIENNNYKVAFPDVPRCYHAGFYGKNRGKQLTGHYKDKISKLGKIIFDNKNMEYMTGGGRHYKDSKPINLNTDYIKLKKNNVGILKIPKNKYRFSIIMPSYLELYKDSATNREEKFLRAVNSVINQTYEYWQLIIIADGCKKTVDLYKTHFSKYNNIDCYKIDKQNLWSGNVRHSGIMKAEGELIIYLDTDDYYGPDHLRKVNSKIKKYDWIYYNDIDISNGIPKIKYAKLKTGFATTSSICHKRSLNVGWLDLSSYTHDIEFIRRLQKKSNNYKFVGECDYYICHWAHSKVEH